MINTLKFVLNKNKSNKKQKKQEKLTFIKQIKNQQTKKNEIFYLTGEI